MVNYSMLAENIFHSQLYDWLYWLFNFMTTFQYQCLFFIHAAVYLQKAITYNL